MNVPTIDNSIHLNLYQIRGKDFWRSDAPARWTVAAKDATRAQLAITHGSDSLSTDDRIESVMFVGSAEFDATLLNICFYKNAEGWVL